MAFTAARQRKHAGIGYVFTADDPYTGIDLDDCIENETIAPWALDIVSTMNSYSEISPSGTGIKIWVEGKLSTNIKTPHIEIYSAARYFTVTGRHVPNTPTSIRYVNGELARLAETIRPPVVEAETVVALSARVTDSAYLRQWADGVIDSALARVRSAPHGTKHNTLLDMSRLLGGLIPLGLATDADLLTLLLQTTDAHKESPHTARTTIRDGLAMGMSKPLTPPEAPPQPMFDADEFACCPHHKTRLPAAKNGNGYKCHQKDDGTASGWCDFWWKGDGYNVPQSKAPEPVIVAGEIISQAPVTAAQPTARFVLYNLNGMRNLPPVTWLIDGEVPAGLTTLICGASEAGKSFLAIDYALQTARKHPERAVVYIAPEGGSGYHQRVDAWLAYHGGEEPKNIFFILQSVTILNPQTLGELITTIRSLNPVMVVIDTLARTLVGGDENSAKDIGMFFYHTDIIREQTHAAILVVHHTGKTGQYRGSSSLIGSVDSWIDFSNDDGLITVACGKAKDWERFPPRYLRMVKSADSVVLLPSDQVDQRADGLSEGKRKILETLALDIFRDSGAKRSEIASGSGVNELTLYKVLSRMKRDRLINQSKKGDPYFISDEGLAAIKGYHRDLRLKRDADELAKQEPRPNAQLANSQPSSNQVATSFPNQLATSYNSPSIREGELATSSGASSDSSGWRDVELFSENTEPTETVPTNKPPAGRAVGAPASESKDYMALDWTYLNQRFDAKDMASITRHCSMRRADVETVLRQIETERGIQEQPSDDEE
jgi:uncharacterized protein YjhX (UPF0386 family)